jgi:uncharacterized protein YecE (DUF72 family)
MRAVDRIRVGVAGWDYRDWAGTVYPFSAPRGFDRLAYVARFVTAVEINSSFYRAVDPRRATSWVRRVEGNPGFRFTAKSHRSWTHESEALSERAVADTLEGLAPLREAGLLGALLVQFPQSFHRTEKAFSRIEQLVNRARDWPVVVEVRHASWSDATAEAWMRERGIGWCVVDQPLIGRSTIRPEARVTAAIGYVRLHGRNVADWFREDAGRDARYDYLYREEELLPLAETAKRLAAAAREVYVIHNNHFRGQALANALQMRHLLGEARIAAPECLVRSYPQLESFVAELPRLF